jgi:hypothetical protein
MTASTDRVPFVALFSTVAYLAGGQVATASQGETVLLDGRQADRLIALGAIRPWRLGDPEPVAAELRLGTAPAPPVSTAEAPAVTPAPTSNANELIAALYGDDDGPRLDLEAFYAVKARQAEEDAAQRAKYQPHTPEHAAEKAKLLAEWEAERRVQQREADERDRHAAEIRAQHQQAVQAELANVAPREAS